MAVGKRKCKAHGNYIREFIVTPKGVFCTIDAAVKYAYKNRIKGADIAHKANKKVFKANDLRPRKSAAKKACHDYIRARDKGKPCPCCGESLGDLFHAGHFLESGSNPKIRYDEDNIHGQRIYCNTYKGGDSGQYKENLIKMIGSDRVKRLINLKGGTVKRTANDYREIESYFKNKLKELNE